MEGLEDLTDRELRREMAKCLGEFADTGSDEVLDRFVDLQLEMNRRADEKGLTEEETLPSHGELEGEIDEEWADCRFFEDS